MKRIFFALLLGFLAYQSAAVAENVTGTVLTVDPNGKMLTVSPTENAEALPAQLEVQLAEDVEFKGDAQSIDDIQPGQTIMLDAEENQDTAQWQAKSVELDQSQQQQQDPAAAGAASGAASGDASISASDPSAADAGSSVSATDASSSGMDASGSTGAASGSAGAGADASGSGASSGSSSGASM